MPAQQQIKIGISRLAIDFRCMRQQDGELARRYLRYSLFEIVNLEAVRVIDSGQIDMLITAHDHLALVEQHIYLAGIDDAHCFKVDNLEKAASQIPSGKFSILLSHTPEIYRQAADADFDLLLSGHTHGGQICLRVFIPIILDAVLPRRMGSGAWRYHNMTGYTSVGAGSSVVPVRLNCPVEITLHCLRCG